MSIINDHDRRGTMVYGAHLCNVVLRVLLVQVLHEEADLSEENGGELHHPPPRWAPPPAAAPAVASSSPMSALQSHVFTAGGGGSALAWGPRGVRGPCSGGRELTPSLYPSLFYASSNPLFLQRLAGDNAGAERFADDPSCISDRAQARLAERVSLASAIGVDRSRRPNSTAHSQPP